ncbi:MAG: hypothetical protein R3B47_04100 [Bacteroidia bacterium]
MLRYLHHRFPPAMPAVAVMGNTTICAGDSVELMVTSTDSI